VGQEGTAEEKNCDGFIPLFHHLMSPDFLSHEDPLVKITVACCLGQLLWFLPSISFLWNDKKLMVSSYVALIAVETYQDI
jgi:hypothetical protein